MAPVSFLKFDRDKATDKAPDNTCTVLVKSLVEGAAPEERTIVIGATNGKFYEIISGLDEGAIILQTEKKSGDENKASNPFSPFGGGKKRK